MNEHVYRRLCMTSVCGAILIPASMALVSGLAAKSPDAASDVARVASTTTAMDTASPGSPGGRDGAARSRPTDRITR